MPWPLTPDRYYRTEMQPHSLCWQNHVLNLGPQTAIMGIVNVTPDSFSDGGRFQAADAAVSHAEHLIRCGADIIDIGGESTRPFAQAVSPKEEIARVLPVIKRLAQFPVPISIDTTKAEVADAALDAGAAMINDISALEMDSQMAAVAIRHGVPVILMHMQGTPRTMQLEPTYDDVVAEVRDYLAAAIRRAVASGIPREKIIVDPGIGFGKTGSGGSVPQTLYPRPCHGAGSAGSRARPGRGGGRHPGRGGRGGHERRPDRTGPRRGKHQGHTQCPGCDSLGITPWGLSDPWNIKWQNPNAKVWMRCARPFKGCWIRGAG
jgi:dihydropteroate synthase